MPREHTTSRREFVWIGGIATLWPGNWFGKSAGFAGIEFQILRPGPNGRHYVWIHGDERTARDVLVNFMKTRNGRAYLIESADRYVEINGGKIDPNRMWSREGAERSLRKENPAWDNGHVADALDKLDRGRDGFLKKLLPPLGEVLVAVHNNGPQYSMNDELSISDSVALNDKDHPDEFMLCTQTSDFQILSGGPFNVLLQNKAPKEDDGSLSRLCARRGIRYVNIEAAIGNAEAQRRMLEWVERVL